MVLTFGWIYFVWVESHVVFVLIKAKVELKLSRKIYSSPCKTWGVFLLGKRKEKIYNPQKKQKQKGKDVVVNFFHSRTQTHGRSKLKNMLKDFFKLFFLSVQLNTHKNTSNINESCWTLDRSNIQQTLPVETFFS